MIGDSIMRKIIITAVLFCISFIGNTAEDVAPVKKMTLAEKKKAARMAEVQKVFPDLWSAYNTKFSSFTDLAADNITVDIDATMAATADLTSELRHIKNRIYCVFGEAKNGYGQGRKIWCYANRNTKVGKRLFDAYKNVKKGKSVTLHLMLKSPKKDFAFGGGVSSTYNCEIVDFLTDEEWRACVKEYLIEEMKHESDVSVKMFVAERTTAPQVYKASARIDDYYNYEFWKSHKEMWSVRFRVKDRLGNSETIHGYVMKDGALGSKVELMLQNGKKHNVKVKLVHPLNAESGDHCIVADIEEIDEEIDD